MENNLSVKCSVRHPPWYLAKHDHMGLALKNLSLPTPKDGKCSLEPKADEEILE